MLSDAAEKRWSSVWWGPGWRRGGGWRASHETPPWRVCSSFLLSPSGPVLSLWDCDISLLIGLSVSRHSPIFPSTCSCLISQETVARGATEGCGVGEWQNLSYISTDRSHSSLLCLWSSSSVWPHAPMWQDPFLGVLCSGHNGYTVTFQAACPSLAPWHQSNHPVTCPNALALQRLCSVLLEASRTFSVAPVPHCSLSRGGAAGEKTSGKSFLLAFVVQNYSTWLFGRIYASMQVLGSIYYVEIIDFCSFSLSTMPGTASELQGNRDESIQVILLGYRWRKEPDAGQVLPGNLRAQVSYLGCRGEAKVGAPGRMRKGLTTCSWWMALTYAWCPLQGEKLVGWGLVPTPSEGGFLTSIRVPLIPVAQSWALGGSSTGPPEYIMTSSAASGARMPGLPPSTLSSHLPHLSQWHHHLETWDSASAFPVFSRLSSPGTKSGFRFSGFNVLNFFIESLLPSCRQCWNPDHCHLSSPW